MLLPEDFREFIELMNRGNVKYVMIGGYAYNLYRSPRATGDIDFLVEPSTENEQRLRRVLEQFGFGSTLPPNGEGLLVLGKVIMLGRSPMRIDLLTSIDGVSFDEVYETKRKFAIEGLEVNVIALEKLLQNKLASNRPKDLADAIELKKLV